MHGHQESSALALAAAKAGLADAEEKTTAAKADLVRLPEADTEARRAATARLSYWGQIAERYRTEIARLRHEEQGRRSP